MMKTTILAIVMVGLALATPVRVLSNTSVLVTPNTVGDPLQQVQVEVSVTTTEEIGFIQFTLEYDASIVSFTDVVLDPSMPLGFTITGEVPSIGAPFSYSPDTNENVLVQISGNGVTHSFTGTQKVAVLTFTFDANACGSSPLNFTTICQRTHLATLDLQAICDPIRVDGTIETNCATDAAPDRRSQLLTVWPNSPNPFNPSTTIRFELARPSHVGVRVFDAKGRQVRLLMHEAAPAGMTSVQWNGRDDAGNTLASGVYLYQVKTPETTSTRSMLLLK